MKPRTASLGLVALAAAAGGVLALRPGRAEPAAASAAAPTALKATRSRREAEITHPPLWHYAPARELRILALCVLATVILTGVVVYAAIKITQPDRATAASGVMPPTPLRETPVGPKIAA